MDGPGYVALHREGPGDPLRAAESRSQNSFNVALLLRVSLCGVSSGGGPGRGRPGAQGVCLGDAYAGSRPD